MRAARQRGDTYQSMTALLAALPPDLNYGLHTEESRNSHVKLFAPHGGCIEPGTDQVVVALAAGEFDYYLFRGLRRQECYKTLHVTSARYDEPACLRMAQAAHLSVSVHGCDAREVSIEVGGARTGAAAALRTHLVRAGYRAVLPAPGRRGEEKENFINRSNDGGVQLELSAGFRAMLFPGFPRTDQRHPMAFREFTGALRAWLLTAEERLSNGLPVVADPTSA